MTIDEALEMLERQFNDQGVEHVIYWPLVPGRSAEVSRLEWQMNGRAEARRYLVEAKHQAAIGQPFRSLEESQEFGRKLGEQTPC